MVRGWYKDSKNVCHLTPFIAEKQVLDLISHFFFVIEI